MAITASKMKSCPTSIEFRINVRIFVNVTKKKIKKKVNKTVFSLNFF